MYKAFEAGQPPVQWIIKVDPEGARDIVRRCKQVESENGEENLIKRIRVTQADKGSTFHQNK